MVDGLIKHSLYCPQVNITETLMLDYAQTDSTISSFEVRNMWSVLVTITEVIDYNIHHILNIVYIPINILMFFFPNSLLKRLEIVIPIFALIRREHQNTGRRDRTILRRFLRSGFGSVVGRHVTKARGPCGREPVRGKPL